MQYSEAHGASVCGPIYPRMTTPSSCACAIRSIRNSRCDAPISISCKVLRWLRARLGDAMADPPVKHSRPGFSTTIEIGAGLGEHIRDRARFEADSIYALDSKSALRASTASRG